MYEHTHTHTHTRTYATSLDELVETDHYIINLTPE